MDFGENQALKRAICANPCAAAFAPSPSTKLIRAAPYNFILRALDFFPPNCYNKVTAMALQPRAGGGAIFVFWTGKKGRGI
jgi:hypothetical protein